MIFKPVQSPVLWVAGPTASTSRAASQVACSLSFSSYQSPLAGIGRGCSGA